MHQVLFEFITGGGMAGQPLPASLAEEGEMMLASLLEDLIATGSQDITVFRDSRLPALSQPVEQIKIDDPRQQIFQAINQGDIVWLIAPETDHALASYADDFIACGARLIASSLDSIKLTSSKYATWQCLNENGIACVFTAKDESLLPDSEMGWVVKPDDGAGAEDTYYFSDRQALTAHLAKQDTRQRLLQPYINGETLSLSMLCLNGDVRLLGCNRQYVERIDNAFRLKAIGVSEIIDDGRLLTLAEQIAQAIPGLAGYVGVDLVRTQAGDSVLEINPRLTTAYAGLSQSTGVNIAEKILSTFLAEQLPDIDMPAVSPVRIVV